MTHVESRTNGVSAHERNRYPHPVDEIEQLNAQIAELTARRDAIAALHAAAQKLIALGYSRRQVRALAGHDLPLA